MSTRRPAGLHKDGQANFLLLDNLTPVVAPHDWQMSDKNGVKSCSSPSSHVSGEHFGAAELIRVAFVDRLRNNQLHLQAAEQCGSAAEPQGCG